MLRVIACPSDQGAVSHYRLRQPADAIERLREPVDITLERGLPMLVNLATGRAERLHPAVTRDTVDAIILQRPFAYWQAVAARDARQRGIAVIVELDDDFHTLDPRNPAWAQTHPNPRVRAQAHHTNRVPATPPDQAAQAAQDWNVHHLRECCRHAHLITTTTPAIAERYAPRGNSIIIPNYADDHWPAIREQTDHLTIGWTGTVATHRDDLQATRGGVAQAARDTNATVRTIGPPQLVAENLSLTTPLDNTPWVPFHQYPHHIARLDVLIAPLADTRFNHAKSWLKPLEASAVGVPVIMSALPEYQRLHTLHGLGTPVNNRAREWRRAVRALLTNRRLRDETAEHARATVAEHLTITRNAWRWPEAWQHAATLATRHAARTAA